MKLDLGCGKEKKDGYIGVDARAVDGVDIIHNLEELPYPFENDSVDEILMDNVLEHLDNVVGVIEELYRILKPGARLIIICPLATHPTASKFVHKTKFFSRDFYYFEESNKMHYMLSDRVNFKILDVQYTIGIPFSDVKQCPVLIIPYVIGRIVRKFASRSLMSREYYEIYLSSFFPMKEFKIVMRKEKLSSEKQEVISKDEDMCFHASHAGAWSGRDAEAYNHAG